MRCISPFPLAVAIYLVAHAARAEPPPPPAPPPLQSPEPSVPAIAPTRAEQGASVQVDSDPRQIGPEPLPAPGAPETREPAASSDRARRRGFRGWPEERREHRQHHHGVAPGQRRAPVTLDARVEFGALDALYHHVQLSRSGTDFDYVEAGGQDVLFPFARLSMELGVRRHHLIFLYQPLQLDTQVTLTAPLLVDGLTFPENTPLDLRYGFPFYRVSYLYDVVRGPRLELALGASLQIRDATITFTSADGAARRSRRDVGPVPTLGARVRYWLGSGWYVASEVDGFYAPVKYLNGGDSDVVGAIIDASLRAGYQLSPRASAFWNVRWLGGGAEGTGEAEDFSDGYTENWLQFLSVSLGVQLTIR
jgi:hypothetical protein